MLNTADRSSEWKTSELTFIEHFVGIVARKA